MKPCPSCGYGNPDSGLKCGICARDISSVPAVQPPAPQKESRLMILTGLLLLACGLAFFVSGLFIDKPARPASGETEFSDEAGFDYEGVLYALDRMAGLDFLPREDKLKVLPLLASHDERVGCAAARLLGAWTREEAAAADARLFFEALVKTAASGRGAVNREAAIEAGLAAAAGFPFAPYAADLAQAAEALSAAEDPYTREAGLLLASMAGGTPNPDLAERAKRALILREQLAIIKK
jgi:hypothetical protein